MRYTKPKDNIKPSILIPPHPPFPHALSSPRLLPLSLLARAGGLADAIARGECVNIHNMTSASMANLTDNEGLRKSQIRSERAQFSVAWLRMHFSFTDIHARCYWTHEIIELFNSRTS